MFVAPADKVMLIIFWDVNGVVLWSQKGKKASEKL